MVRVTRRLLFDENLRVFFFDLICSWLRINLQERMLRNGIIAAIQSLLSPLLSLYELFQMVTSAFGLGAGRSLLLLALSRDVCLVRDLGER